MKKANWIVLYNVMLVFFVSVFLLGDGHAEDELRGIVPVEVELLLSVLPEQVEDWTLTRSRGRQGKDVWLESSATRTFEKVTLDENDTPVTRKVKLTIQDTGEFAESDIMLFSDFTPGNEEGVESLYFNSIPVIVIESGTRLYAQFFLQGRFILSIAFYDLPKRELGDWFKNVNVKLLAGVKDGPVVDLPESYISRSIDELEGRNKRSIIQPDYSSDEGDGNGEEHAPESDE